MMTSGRPQVSASKKAALKSNNLCIGDYVLVTLSELFPRKDKRASRLGTKASGHMTAEPGANQVFDGGHLINFEYKCVNEMIFSLTHQRPNSL